MTKKAVRTILADAVSDEAEEPDLDDTEISVEGGKLWIDVDMPNGSRVHVVLDLARAGCADEVYEYDKE